MVTHQDWTCIVVLHCLMLHVSKLFEAVLVSLFGDSLQSNDLQFGFKRNSSCSHAIFTFNESVRCSMKNGGRVHCVALDATKAFDKVHTMDCSIRCYVKECHCSNICSVTYVLVYTSVECYYVE